MSKVREVQGEEAAIAQALDDLRPGDVLLILLDAVETSLPFIRERLARDAVAKRETLAAASTT